MIIPSTKQILLFFTVNFSLAAVYIILLFKNIDFITHVIFSNILAVNTLKMGMLVFVFILTVFILIFLIFKIKNQPIYSSIKALISVVLAGILPLLEWNYNLTLIETDYEKICIEA